MKLTEELRQKLIAFELKRDAYHWHVSLDSGRNAASTRLEHMQSRLPYERNALEDMRLRHAKEEQEMIEKIAARERAIEEEIKTQQRWLESQEV